MFKAITALVVLLALGFGVGLYLDWFHLSVKRPAAEGDKKLTVSLEVNTEKVKDAAEAAKQKGKEIGAAIKEKIDTVAGTETAKGTVVKVEEAEHRLTVMTSENKELTVLVEESSKVRLKDAPMQLKDLQEGDEVTVIYTVKDGKNIARAVTADRAI